MARASTQDTVERFRFDVRIINVSLSPGSFVNNFTKGTIGQFARVGFSQVDTPEFQNAVMEYRENTDNNVFRKIPGLQRFNEITMSRGVVAAGNREGLNDATKDFYNWTRKVNSANPVLSLVREVSGTQTNSLLEQSDNFRKDMIIILRDRNGRAARRWYLLNAFPTSYKGSSELNAEAQEKAVERLTIAYELAFELPSISDVAKEFIADITDSPFADLADDADFDLGF